MLLHHLDPELPMTIVEQLAAFVERASYDDLAPSGREQLKIRILDSIACAIGALTGEPIGLIQEQTQEFDGIGLCTLIGGGRTAPDRAAFYNSALVRYLDFNDSFLASGETCHPSDNFGAVMAAGEYAGGSGRDLLTALAVAYHVQCRLSEVAPVRDKGFDHTTQGSYAVAAGVSKALGLSREQTANAIAIAGTAFNALRVTRTGMLSHWKGLAYANAAFGATHAAFLAKRGVTGPLEVFEGNKGFMESIAGPFEIDWSKENLDAVPCTIVKRYNAEIHSQSAIEGALELKHEYQFTGADVEQIQIDIFDVAYHIIGGGEEGDKTVVHTKEQADHSLQFLVAVGILDDQVMPEQYLPERIQRADVQDLLRKVFVRPAAGYSQKFPNEMPCRITVHLQDGRTFGKEKHDYEGFHTRPMTWQHVADKFERLARAFTDEPLRKELLGCVAHLETKSVADLAVLLGRARAVRSLPANKRRTQI